VTMAPALLLASLSFSPSSRPLATHTRAAPAQAALFGPGGLFTSIGGLGFASAADRYVDPLDARGLETYSGGVTSRVWYTPPTEWNDLLFALNHEAIRHELLRLERITEAMVGGERRKPTDSTFKSLGQFFDEYVAAPIRFQHALEDEVLFPAIKAAGVEVPAAITRREVAAEAVDAFEPGINTYWLFTPFAEEDFGVPKAWDDAELDEFKAMIEEGNSGSNGLEDTERATAKAAARLAALVGSLLEAKERQLSPLIAPLGKTFAADLQGKVEEWAAGNTRAAQMKEMAACVPMAGAGGPGPAKRAKLVAGALAAPETAAAAQARDGFDTLFDGAGAWKSGKSVPETRL